VAIDWRQLFRAVRTVLRCAKPSISPFVDFRQRQSGVRRTSLTLQGVKEVAMNFLTLVVIVATLATVAALALGISSMVCDGEIAQFDRENWMASRVFL
jgi:hypothetical protein